MEKRAKKELWFHKLNENVSSRRKNGKLHDLLVIVRLISVDFLPFPIECVRAEL